MKKTLVCGASLAILLSPLAMAETRVEKVNPAISAAKDYGMIYLQEIDFDDDGSAEIEGWLDEQWFAEIEISVDGNVTHEERKRRDDQPRGMSFEEIKNVIDAASLEGMVYVEEISVGRDGGIDIEGEDGQGKEVELDNMAIAASYAGKGQNK